LLTSIHKDKKLYQIMENLPKFTLNNRYSDMKKGFKEVGSHSNHSLN
jgi:hypothetical protein